MVKRRDSGRCSRLQSRWSFGAQITLAGLHIGVRMTGDLVFASNGAGLARREMRLMVLLVLRLSKVNRQTYRKLGKQYSIYTEYHGITQTYSAP